MNTKIVGRKGEEIAAKFLSEKGYEIFCKNWTCRWGEIDLITIFKGILVFVEVKYRNSLDFGYPYEAVNYRKKAVLVRSISRFLLLGNVWGCNWRLDLVSIYIIGGKVNIKHFEGIPLDGLF